MLWPGRGTPSATALAASAASCPNSSTTSSSSHSCPSATQEHSPGSRTRHITSSASVVYCRNFKPGSSWGYAGVSLGSTRGQTGVKLGSSWGQAGVKLGSSWGQAGVKLGSSWGQTGVKLGSSWGQAGVKLGSSWGQAGVNLQRPTSPVARARLTAFSTRPAAAAMGSAGCAAAPYIRGLHSFG